VWQEAVPGLRALVRQRSRWLQGHLVAWAFVPDVARSRLPLWTRVDLLTFLLLPIVFVPIGAGSVLSWLAFVIDAGHWSTDGLLVFYTLAFGVVPLAAEILTRAHREPLPRAVVRAHIFVFYSFVWFLASVVACWNVVLGRRGWIKTSRIESTARLDTSGLVLVLVSAVALLLISGATGVKAQVAPDRLAPSAPNVLVINQSSPSYPVVALRRGAQITLALRHFTPNAQMIDDQHYAAGALFGFDRVVVIANDALTEIPAVLRADLATSQLPVLWLGYDLDQVPELSQRAGVYFGDETNTDLPRTVEYRGHQYPAQPDDLNLLRTGPGVEVLARYIGRQEVPYIVHGGTLWYVNGLPEFDTDSPDPATDAPNLIFADVLHDFFSTGVPPRPAPRAVIRLEDVSVHISPRTIRAIADDLSSQHVPFAMGVIPAQRFEDGSVVPISDRPAFADSLRYAQDHGGTIILHGYHHTFGSGEDFEFWDPDRNAPLAGETETEVAAKVEDGIRILRDQGLEPRLWETPHYSASPLDYQVFSRYFSHAIENREPVSWLPYPASPDPYGQTLIPENLGYINPQEGHTVEAQLARAGLLRIVRDAWGVGFYHPASIDQVELDRLVDGLRKLGYSFTDLRDQPLQTRSEYNPLPHEVALNRARQQAASVDGAVQLPEPPPPVRGIPLPQLPWPSLLGLSAFGLFLFRLRAQWQPTSAASIVEVSVSPVHGRPPGWVILAVAGVVGAAGIACIALVRGPETVRPAVFDARGWELSVYYTAVEDFYPGPDADLVGCPALGCLQASQSLGNFPEDFLQAVKDEGSGRITRGPSAGRYLNWSVDIGYWLDTFPRDARGEPLRAYETAAADERVAFGTLLQVIDCGQDVLSQELLPAPVCQPLSSAHWVVWDRFGEAGVGKHVDLYIGEQDQPDFVRRSSRVINTIGGTVALGGPDGQ
jgi:uncharacterized protein DUF2334